MANIKKIIELELDSSGAIVGIKEVGAELDKVEKKGKEASKSVGFLDVIEKVSPKAASAIKGFTSSVGGLSMGFKGLKAAIIGTGIGALVIAVTSLVTYFTKTKRGAELLERGMAGLGAVFSVITDRMAAFGEAIIMAFENPQQAIEDLWDFIETNIENRLAGFTDQFLAFGEMLEGVFTLDWDKATEGASDFATATIQIGTGLDAEQQKAVADAIIDTGNAMAEAATKADALTQAAQRLRDAERELSVETANRRADIKALNLIAEDTTKSYAERAEAATKANDIEKNLMAQRLAAAEENVRIIREQNALAESGEEDLNGLADAEIELANIRAESLEMQTTLGNKLNAISAQQRAEYLAKVKAAEEERKRLADEFEALEVERNKRMVEAEKAMLEEIQTVREFLHSKQTQTEQEQIQDKYERLREQANGELELLKELKMQENAELSALQLKQYQDEEAQRQADVKKQIDADNQLREQRISNAKAIFSGVQAISDLFANSSEKNARKQFAVNKALGVADALVSTYSAIAGQLAAFSKNPIPGYAIAQAIATGLVGLAQVKKIASAKFGGGVSGGISSQGGGGALGQGASATPQPTAALSLGGLQQQPQQAPIPAYVIGSQIQSNQEASQRVKDLSSL